ncbi:MAG: Maf family protein [Candidatus Omnitrophica bacterium]|nr:Maf family protein [Candidatus Omnitrophota bacterium]MDD5436413.1 Maf family protein [Candidatus Omnitrophota bacterium]
MRKAKARRIILASKSKARQKLLRQIGLKFSVAGSCVDEEHKLRGRCSDLVIINALRKARGVAAGLDSGVVIGADTVVLVGKKIVGKPRTIADAYRALRLLSKKPQWVYTGLAVIDIDNRRIYTDHEKTKVYMYPLSDAQIRHYFKKISPFDKAGSFDVQGPGSVFIDRIEGCFYNVVGLPLAKLAKIFRRIGIEIF